MLRRVLQIFVFIGALAALPVHANTCMGIVTLSMHSNFCASVGGVSCGYSAGSTAYAAYGCSGGTGLIGAGYCSEPACAGFIWGIVNACPAGQLPDTNGLCMLDCAPGTHESNGTCVPDPVSCQEHQTDINGTCTPDTPEPEIGPQSTQPVVAGTCQSYEAGNCVLDSQLLAGGSLPANCGGWSCTASAGNATSPANCYQISSAPTSLFCDFNPIYSGGGPYVSSTSTVTSGTQQQTTVCPSGSSLGADGLCHSGASSGTSTSLTGAGTPGSSGTAVCPVGSTLDGTGHCVLSTTGGCPAGFVAGPNGTCSSVSTIGQDGRASTGGGTSSTGIACGGPGQPSCNVKVDGSDIPSNAASGTTLDTGPLDQSYADTLNAINNFADPASSKKTEFADSVGNWISPIPITSCSPWVSTINGNTWTVDFCSKAAVIASWLEYVMWFLLALSTFRMLTTAHPSS